MGKPTGTSKPDLASDLASDLVSDLVSDSDFHSILRHMSPNRHDHLFCTCCLVVTSSSGVRQGCGDSNKNIQFVS